MSRRAISVVIFFICVVPALSLAQTSTAELQEKINAILQQIKVLQDRIAALQGGGATTASTTNTTASLASCPELSRTLAVGARGSDVLQLQQFLREHGFFTEEPTGYFGPITEAAVRRLQAAHGLVSSGSAQTTGYGVVGPRTRALIADLCRASASTGGVPATQTSSTTATSTVLLCPLIASLTAPTSACSGVWEKLMSLGCHVGWRCNLSGSGANKPPVIASIEGPTALAVGTFGTWRINAIDPEKAALSYSVIWGDEGVEDILSALAGLGGTYTSSPTISHSYSKSGTFTLNVSVRDSAGQVASATYTVAVSAGGNNVPLFFLPPLATTTVSASCVTPWGSQVVHHLGTTVWQPFFTEGFYFNATSTPIMRCENGNWRKCDASGANCQAYAVATSTSQGSLPSYTGTIGQPCPHYGATMVVSVPIGTQLCQWLSCTVAQEVQTVTLKCEHSGWADTSPFKNQQIQ